MMPNNAAHPLYIAINGIDAVTIIRYISALCITPGSIFPNTTFKIKFLHA